MGLPIKVPSYIYGDNMSVIYNTSRPESVLRKKSNSICYHFVRESVAANECLTSHINTLKNISDLLTKLLYGQKNQNLVKGLLCDIMTMTRTTEIDCRFVGLKQCSQFYSYGLTTLGEC